MDHTYSVTKVAILDALPVIDHLDRCDARFARAYWHWFFFAQPVYSFPLLWSCLAHAAPAALARKRA
jgi:haloacetate dehalogenase